MQFKNAIATLALASVGGVDAFFRINCAKIQVGRIDPIVNPGALAAHCHTIVGGSSKYRHDAHLCTQLTIMGRHRCERNVQQFVPVRMHFL